MVKIIKKILLHFKNEFLDEKKIISIGKYDTEKSREIYYVSTVRGTTRRSKKSRITRDKFEELKRIANLVEEIKNNVA